MVLDILVLIITTNINITVVRNQINEDIYFLHFTDRSYQICKNINVSFFKIFICACVVNRNIIVCR